ncbi:MAG: helix-turn-helix transcriptional regulator [Enterocloster citroniae]|nr:helix-turn-helix transcriptional regulator [Enterocloster citroniae]
MVDISKLEKMYEEIFTHEILDILKKAKKEKGLSFRELGETCSYEKSEMWNFLNEKRDLLPEVARKLIERLEVEDETSRFALLERLDRSIYQGEYPDATEEEIESMMEMERSGEDAWEIDQLEKEQEQQLKEMESWFMGMEPWECCLLAENYKRYEYGQMPDEAIRFIQNYMGLNKEDKETIRKCMTRLTVPMDNLTWTLRVANRYQRLMYLNVEGIKSKADDETTHKGDMGNCKSTKAVRDFKVKHWEAFRSQLKASSYITGTYFYKNMRLLVKMDTDMCRMVIMFLLLGDDGDSVTEWQKFFMHIGSGAEEKDGNSRGEKGCLES